MILEAFSEYLHAADENVPATELLARWLWERLSSPPRCVVDQVLHCEIKLSRSRRPVPGFSLRLKDQNSPTFVFKGNSLSGTKLLKSLYEYCLSYEQQKWSRWVHSLKASDFKYCK